MTASNSFFFALLILYLENAARIPLCDGTIVGDHDDGCAMLLIDAAQEPEYAFGRLFVEVSCRLVGDYHFRSIEQSPRYGYSLLFSSRELMRHLVGFGLHVH